MRELTPEEFKYNQLYHTMLAHLAESKRLSSMAFDHTHPVDEYEIIGQNAASLDLGITIRIQYDYDERYDCILYSLPLGTTSASLQIGTDRTLQLYNGAAIAVQQMQSLPHLGIVCSSGDERILTLTGTLTSNGFIEMTGWALSRGIER
jgi:hypothetical protein